MGLLPYRQRLQRLRLTTLPERRMRGYLIDSFKIIVYYGQNMFEKIQLTKHAIFQSFRIIL